MDVIIMVIIKIIIIQYASTIVLFSSSDFKCSPQFLAPDEFEEFVTWCYLHIVSPIKNKKIINCIPCLHIINIRRGTIVRKRTWRIQRRRWSGGSEIIPLQYFINETAQEMDCNNNSDDPNNNNNIVCFIKWVTKLF